MISYEGKVVVVTGGGEGSIGESHAKSFAKRGACVVVNDIKVEAANATVEAITNANGQAIANHDSVLDGTAIVNQTLETYGRIDVMLNNAGIDGVGPEGPLNVGEISEGFWRQTLDVHLMGTFACTKAALKPMQEQGSGRILVTSSPTGIFGCTGANAYATAKAALFGFMQCVALEYRDHGITCNALVPVSAGGTTCQGAPVRWAQWKRVARAHAEYVSEFAAWLAHDSCSVSGKAFEVGSPLEAIFTLSEFRWAQAFIWKRLTTQLKLSLITRSKCQILLTASILTSSGRVERARARGPNGRPASVLNKIAEKAGVPPMEAVRLPSQPR